jgi:aspartate carbamoyltransferase catalytic subunit
MPVSSSPAQASTLHHLLQLASIPGSSSTLRKLLSLAKTYAGHDADGSMDPAAWRQKLKGKVIANLFFEDSTRTRVSFSVAARRLGAEVIDLTTSGSSVSKGESVVDTAMNVAAMGVDALVMRHKSSGAPHLVARILTERSAAIGVGQGTRAAVPAVVNAGDGRHEHPTQGLLDAYTIAESFGRLDNFDLSGLRVGIIGDIASSRVARSNLACLQALGAQVVFIGPPTLVPAAFASMGATVTHDLDAHLPTLDVINVLRIQFERHDAGPPQQAMGVSAPQVSAVSTGAAIASVREYHERYGLHQARLARLKQGAIIMHPGPINRGVEMTAMAADDPRSVVLKQVRHGVATRMAVLETLLTR